MGSSQMVVATHESSENATGLPTCTKTILVSSVFTTATQMRKLSAEPIQNAEACESEEAASF